MARHRVPGRKRKYSDADIAQMEAMRATMTLKEIGKFYGVCAKVIMKQIQEHGEPSDTVFRPRVLRRWPRKTNFAPDNLAVRN
jgi:hypothetical protein